MLLSPLLPFLNALIKVNMQRSIIQWLSKHTIKLHYPIVEPFHTDNTSAATSPAITVAFNLVSLDI
jgi:hypothetical protein